MNLIKNINPVFGLAPIAAANNTDSNTAIMDMSGYDGIIFVTSITDSVATGVATMTIEQDALNADGAMSALSGATATVTCAVNDDQNDKLLIVDVYRPLKRYVQAVLTSATANIAFGTTIAYRYKGKKRPETDDDSIGQATSVVSPSEA